MITPLYLVYPAKYRHQYFENPKNFQSKFFVDVNFYHKLNYDYYRSHPHLDQSAVPYYLINKNKIQFPSYIVLKPLNYNKWKIYSSYHSTIPNIIKILNETIVAMEPANFNLINLIKKRPLFWNNLFQIIEQISDYKIFTDAKEKELAKHVDSAAGRYKSSLDGIYDIFVLQNFPDFFIHYRSLEYYDRLDFLGLMQASSNINMYENLQNYRTGKIKYLKFNYQDPKFLPKELKEKGISEEAVMEAHQKLQERIEKERKAKIKRSVNTKYENKEFTKLGV